MAAPSVIIGQPGTTEGECSPAWPSGGRPQAGAIHGTGSLEGVGTNHFTPYSAFTSRSRLAWLDGRA